MLIPRPLGPIPDETRRVGEILLDPDSPYRYIGDVLATALDDELFADAYPSMGAPNDHSPARLALVSILQVLENVSDRVAAHMVRTRLDWKYALHLPLDDVGFDSTLLVDFRHRLEKHTAEAKVFERVLEQFTQEGFLSRRGRQRTDAISVLAAVRQLNRIELVMETLRLALEEIARKDRSWLQQHAEPEWLDRYGEWVSAERLVKATGPKAKAEVDALLKQTGVDGFAVLDLLEQETTPEHLRTGDAVERLKRVWREQYRRTTPPDPEGGGTLIEMHTAKTREQDGISHDTLETPHDEEARYNGRPGKQMVGYKVHLTETADPEMPAIITDVEVVAANTYDGHQVDGIQRRLQERGFEIEEQLVDSGYIDSKTLVSSQKRKVELVGPMRLGPAGPDPQELEEAREGEKFGAERFEIDMEGKKAVCPAGKESIDWDEKPRKDQNGNVTIVVRWNTRDCEQCPLRAYCTRAKSTGRQLRISPNYEAVAAHREAQRSREFSRKYRRRAGVEATMSRVVRDHGGRKTRYRGIGKTRGRYTFIAVAINIKRVVAWKSEKNKKPKRTRPAALRRLMGDEAANARGWGQKRVA